MRGNVPCRAATAEACLRVLITSKGLVQIAATFVTTFADELGFAAQVRMGRTHGSADCSTCESDGPSLITSLGYRFTKAGACEHALHDFVTSPINSAKRDISP